MPAARNSRSKAVDAPQDLRLARRLLDQADRHIASASIDGVDRDSRFGLLYDGAQKAADAILRANGRRVTAGVGHHIAYLAEAKRALGPDHEALWTRIETARSIRNDMEYRGREVSELELTELDAAATQIVVAARVYVGAMPPT